MSATRIGELPPGFRCLAIETSSPVSSIAACAGGRVASAEYGSPGTQSRHVYDCVRDALREARVTLAELDCVAFGCGPGGFTGLRVGAAVAQALAFGAGLPVCRISSLAVLAAAAIDRHGVDCVAACVDARMDEAYVGVYRAADGGVTTVVADRLAAPGAGALLGDEAFFAAGPGWAAYPQLAADSAAPTTGSDHELLPRAETLLRLAAGDYARGHTVVPHEAVPNYVRNNVTS